MKSPQKKPKEKKPLPKPNKTVKQAVQKTWTLDASGKILGRLATEVATILRGKHKPQFRPHLLVGDKVIIINAAKIKVTGNKMTDKKYFRHSGYIGSLKTETLGEVFSKNPSEVIRRAVRGMLPKNKLQDQWMKNLTIRNGE